ncbi:prenyltransferase/squalene oxidase repeat-containing protein [Streptomyces lavendulae]|uniref:prenyltransferase/squalene oxidase repeat-containing protein n=1 Tax=Streptomyces lavendulae TaxID=1914 RepID=UPI00380A79F1
MRAAVARAQRRPLVLQTSAGWWKGEQDTNITRDAEELLLREFLGIGTPRLTTETARWNRSQQHGDGTWPVYFDGPGDLPTTVEEYLAPRLAGHRPRKPHMSRAAAWVRGHGGAEGSQVFTRMWMAMFGLRPWRGLPALPPELALLPRTVPLNIYDWGYWAHQNVLPLTVVSHFRPSRPLPFTVPELHLAVCCPAPKARSAPWSVAGGIRRLNSAPHVWEERVPHRHKPLRPRALRAIERWIVLRQDADGSWGGLQASWVYSILALHLLGYPLDHPVMRAALDGPEVFIIREDHPSGPVRRSEACQGPVWDTALSVIALLDSGLDPAHPALAKAHPLAPRPGSTHLRGLGRATSRDSTGRGAFEFHNAHYPDIDDTAEAVMALGRHQPCDPVLARHSREAQRRAVAWVIGTQSRDGGWGAFDADNISGLVTRLPFCGFGEVTGPPSTDVTAHAVEMLCAQGLASSQATREAVCHPLAQQEADGSWFGRWGVNHVYGTGAVLPALAAAGIPPQHHPAVRRAVDWLA